MKNKNNWLSLFLFLLLTGCIEEKKTIHYEYNGVVVTRLDIGNESYFYYGKYTSKEITKQKNYLKAYSFGWDGVMYGHLIFHSDKTVELVQGAGKYEEKGKNDSLFFSTEKFFLKKREIFPFDSIVYISDYPAEEQQRIFSDSSNVIVNVIDSCKVIVW
jgi:hypothetical protein